ncbi:hypothetical protein Ae201684P_016141 [Aphanomyces euteiches]|nr:hypothetical protein Ae201684P_016141 [Aphanomyces euteiches]
MATPPPTSTTPQQFVTSRPQAALEEHTLLGKARQTLLAQVVGLENPAMATFVQSFFDTTLADAIQERETKYVNTMTEVFRQEMKERNDALAKLSTKISQLESRVVEGDQTASVLHAKLDRRNHEMDVLRRTHFKELLMLREMVTKQKTDTRTLKALEDALAVGRSSNNEGDDGTPGDSPRRNSASLSIEARLELLKIDVDKRKKFNDALRDERDKWQQRAVEAMEQVEALKSVLHTKRDANSSGDPHLSTAYLSLSPSSSPWWAGGPEGGMHERDAIETAIANHELTSDDVASALIEVLGTVDVWPALGALMQQAPDGPAACGFASLLGSPLALVMGRHPSWSSSSPSADGDAARLDEKEQADEANLLLNNTQCSKCHGTGFVDANEVAAEADSERERVKALLKTVDSLREELQACQTRVVDLEIAHDEVESAKRALVASVAEYQTTLNNAHAQVAADAKAREDARLALEQSKKHIATQTSDGAVDSKPLNGGRRHAAIARQASAPTEAELGILSRAALEDLLAEKCTAINELEAAQLRQVDNIAELQRQVVENADKLTSFHRAADTAQQLLRQEITVLKDTLASIQSQSSVAMLEKQATLSSFLAKTKTDHMMNRPVHFESTMPPRDASRASLMVINQTQEAKLLEAIEWSDVDVQAEELAQSTAEAACRAEAELDDLPLCFIKEDARVDEVPLPDEVTDLKDRIQTMQVEAEAAKTSSRKMHTVQMSRIVTLSSHLSKLASEMLVLRKKSSAEIAFWKTECEKQDQAMQCLVTEFNLYKSTHRIQAENSIMESLVQASQEASWHRHGPKATAFIADLQEACRSSPGDPVLAKFALFGEKIQVMHDDNNDEYNGSGGSGNGGGCRMFLALKGIYDAWQDKQSASPRKLLKKYKSKGVKHGKTTTQLIDPAASPATKASKRMSVGPSSPSRDQGSRRTSSKSKRLSTIFSKHAMGMDSPPSSSSSPEKGSSPDKWEKSSPQRRRMHGSASSSPTGGSLASPTGTLSASVKVPPAFPLTAVDELVDTNSRAPQVDVPSPLDDMAMPPLSSFTAKQEHANLEVTTVDTPSSAMLASDDGHIAFDLPPADPRRHMPPQIQQQQLQQQPKELQYLKSLALNRRETLASLAMSQWALLVLKLQVESMHARAHEMKERRVRFNRPHVAMQSMSELMHHGIQRREQALAETRQRFEQLRDRLKHVNLCILHATSIVFYDDLPSNNRKGRRRYHLPGSSGFRRSELLDMSVVDLSHLPPSQQIPTSHFPIPMENNNTATPPPEPATGPATALLSPFKMQKRFPNRTTKFLQDSRAHDHSLVHVTKLVYPKSAGPIRSTAVALFSQKQSIAVIGHGAIEAIDGATHPSTETTHGVLGTMQVRVKTSKPRDDEDRRPHRPRSTPTYLSRTMAIRQSPRQQRSQQVEYYTFVDR